MASEPLRILKTRDVATRLGVSPQALRVKRMKGDGPPWTRLSRNRVGYPEESLLEWIKSRTFRSIAEERHGRPAA
jgi:predicted DNA-binding transcriptional regulator AlpA